MRQPTLGVVASAAVIVVSLVVIWLLGVDLFMGWGSYLLMCAIPFTVIVGAFWRGSEPAAVARLRQPARGLGYLALAAVVAGIVGVIHWSLRGGGISPPVPMAVMTIITSVVTTFFLVIVWGGWPFSLIRNRLVAGLALLVGCYLVNAVIFQFMRFDFLAGAPFAQALDPGGPFDAWSVVVVMVTALSLMFGFLLVDLWPLTRSAMLREHPLRLALVWTLTCFVLAVVVYQVGLAVTGLPAPTFLVSVPIPFLFGEILVFNMLGGSLFAGLRQPARGLAAALVALVAGNLLALGYRALMPVLSGDLPAGPDGNFAAELWLANSLLAVTFPFLAFYGDYFGLWPLAAQQEQEPVNA
ncbi:MAG: hypothetical protein ACK5MT_02980 [Actinomycetales bacterium]